MSPGNKESRYTYHGWRCTNSKPMTCTSMQSKICPNSGVKTFRLTRLAVGRLRQRVRYGPVHPTVKLSAYDHHLQMMSGLLKIAIGRTKSISTNKNYSPISGDYYKDGNVMCT